MPIKIYVQGEKADIAVFIDETGKSDVIDFIESLPDSDQEKVANLFNLFCQQGRIWNEEKFKKEEGRIWAFKSFQVRILCAFLPRKLKPTVLLLHALHKKADRLARSDVKKARFLLDNILKSI
jgi:hypothetical protein